MSDNKFKPGNILQKIITAIRDDSRLLTEAVLDAGGAEKFENEIDNAKFKLNSAQLEINEVKVKELQTARKIEITQAQIMEQENLMAEALAQGDEAKALGMAQVVVDLEQDINMLSTLQNTLQLNTAHLTSQMEQLERQMKDFARQLTMVRTTENVQQATAAIDKKFTEIDSQLWSAQTALSRITAKQERVEQDLAHDNVNQQHISQKQLTSEDAPLNQSKAPRLQAEDVLNRLKNRD